MANLYTSAGLTFSDLLHGIERKVHDFTNITWIETDINSLINEGCLDFVRRSQCYKGSSSFAITANTNTYTLDDDVMQILRASYNRLPLNIVTNSHMDDYYGGSWRNSTGDGINTLVQDTENYNYIYAYPVIDSFDDLYIDIVDSFNTLVFRYNSTTTSTITIPTGSYTGDTLAIELSSLLNTAFSLSTITVTFSDTTGKFTVATNNSNVIAFISTGSMGSESTGFIISTVTAAESITSDGAFRVYIDYVKYPLTLVATTDKPTAIPPQFHPALRYYALHNILEDSVNQSQDVGMSNRFWTKYMDMVTACRRFTGIGVSSKPTTMTYPNFIIR